MTLTFFLAIGLLAGGAIGWLGATIYIHRLLAPEIQTLYDIPDGRRVLGREK